MSAESLPVESMVITHDEMIAFYDEHLDAVFGYACRLCGHDRARAEDLTQDAFVSLVRSIRSGAVHELSVGWVYVAVRHRFLDDLRSREREQRRLALVAERPGPPDPARLYDAIADLPDDQRAALVLHHLDGFPVRDVARHLGRSTEAAQSLLARARRSLRDIITEERDDA